MPNAPPNHPNTTGGELGSLEDQIARLKAREKLSEDEVVALCDKVRAAPSLCVGGAARGPFCQLCGALALHRPLPPALPP